MTGLVAAGEPAPVATCAQGWCLQAARVLLPIVQQLLLPDCSEGGVSRIHAAGQRSVTSRSAEREIMCITAQGDNTEARSRALTP